MEIRILLSSNSPAICLAAEELCKYLPKIDPTVDAAILRIAEDDSTLKGIRLAVSDRCQRCTENPELDDAIAIDVKNGAGTIEGSNPRSVLIAAYRFLQEAGCRWIRPGEDGEKILHQNLECFSVCLEEKASYRHRGVCIEGACSYQHVQQMIEWMPKAGLNGYFHQFMVPYTFFDQWYSHYSNPGMKPQETSVEEVAGMVESTIDAIKKRGMLLHRVGHGWTCEPFGIPGLGWNAEEYHLSEAESAPFALVNGKRGIWQGIPLNTNLCYSNSTVRRNVTEFVVAYAKKHPQVDYLHVWLADEANNHCECDECRKSQPSDLYIQLLNEINNALEQAELKTRIVFLNYMDLLWAPVERKIENQERFSMMFAPISRTYSNTLLDGIESKQGQTVPYCRNRLELPTKVEDNLAYLRDWQAGFTGDSFLFDYHMLWDWNFDLGGYRSAQVLFEDMKDLNKLGLNGMMSCQMQRAAFPTGLGLTAMAKALWNHQSSFEQVAKQYFQDVFGEYAEEMECYFKDLSRLFHPPYLRLEEEIVNPERARDYQLLVSRIQQTKPLLKQAAQKAAASYDRMTWKYLLVHAEICSLMASTLEKMALGNQEKAEELWQKTVDYANQMEPELHRVWDVSYFLKVVGAAVRSEKRPGLS
ncbi:MAG: DUF4838 domain-containing protein [Oscillospiraceae bacterium]|jgi:hypothetical protein